MTARYLYALVPAADAPERARAGHVSLEFVPAGPGLVAVAGPAPQAHGMDALRAHDAVVRALHKKLPSVLPFRFDTRVADAAALRRALRPQGKALRAALDEVRGRTQMALRLVGPPPAAKGAARGSGAQYLRARAARARVPELDGVREALHALVLAERTARPEQGALRACAYHLVDREKTGAYLRKVRGAGFAHPDLRLVVSGPDPAWAFAPEVDAWR